MKNKFTAAASVAMSLCVLAGCSTEHEESSQSSSINIIDIGSVSSSSASASSSASVIPAAPTVSSSGLVSSSLTSTASSSVMSSSSTIVQSTVEPHPESSSAISEDRGFVESVISSSDYSPPASLSEPHSSAPTESEPPASSNEPQPVPEESSTASSVSSSVESTSSSTSQSSSSSSTSTQLSSSSSEPDDIPAEPSGTNSYQAINYAEVKGMWISYLDIMEMSSGTESAFRSEIAAAYDNCAALGINTVYVHVRSHGDAYYYSDYFPRTKYMSGSYDPLPIMIEEAHRRGLSFQAWINPLRMCAAKDLSLESGYPIYDWAGGERQLVQVSSYYYLNPAYSEVIDLITKSSVEIVANYDVDGLHIDDYFYPTTDSYFDSEAFFDSGYSYISDFRRANCDRLVSSLYSAVKTANPTAVFGVSCQGNMDNNYNQMYADVEKWCRSSGYLDYIMPQIYFGFDNSTQPFAECVRRWDNAASKGNVPLIVGLTASKFGEEDVWAGSGRNEWINDRSILRRQFLESAEQASYGGICLFRYRLLFAPGSSVRTQIESELSDLRSVIY